VQSTATAVPMSHDNCRVLFLSLFSYGRFEFRFSTLQLIPESGRCVESEHEYERSRSRRTSDAAALPMRCSLAHLKFQPTQRVRAGHGACPQHGPVSPPLPQPNSGSIREKLVGQPDGRVGEGSVRSPLPPPRGFRRRTRRQSPS
jgi:hypothetical protein